MSHLPIAAPEPSRRGATVAHISALIDHLAADLHAGETTDSLAPLWPLLVEIMEANCLPGNELHPEVDALYARFASLTTNPGLLDEGGYVAWLAGTPADSDVKARSNMLRWESRTR